MKNMKHKIDMYRLRVMEQGKYDSLIVQSKVTRSQSRNSQLNNQSCFGIH